MNRETVTPLGRNVIGKPARCEGGGYRREDTYHSNQADAKPSPYLVFVAGPEDMSDTVSTYGEHANARYAFGCSCCFLGFAHSLELHNRDGQKPTP